MCEKIGGTVCDKMTNMNQETAVMITSGSEGRRSHYRQILAALAVSLGTFAAGLSKGYMSPAIASMQEIKAHNSSTFTVTDQQSSWIVSFSLIGALLGGILGGFVMKLGRRRVILAAALPYTLCWVATGLSNGFNMLAGTSFLGGVLACLISMVTQVYVTEIAVAEIRGCLSSVLKVLSQVGVLISFSLGAYLNWYNLAFVIAGAPILLFIALIFVPETPSSLLLQGKVEEAELSLQWLRGPEADITVELATIRKNIMASKQSHEGSTGRFRALFSKRLLRPVLITCGLMFFQRFTGTHVFNFYAVPIFKKTLKTINPHGAAISISGIQLLASCVSGMLIDNVGRLPLLLVSGGMMALALAGFGTYAYYEEYLRLFTAQTMTEPRFYDWIPLACVVIFTIAFALGIGPISNLLIVELFPLEHRSTGSALATSFSNLCASANAKVFIDIKNAIGMYGLFWLYAVIAGFGLLFVLLFVPETKGKKIDEMDPHYVETLSLNR